MIASVPGLCMLFYFNEQIILVSVKVAKSPPFEKKLVYQLSISTICIMSICCFSYYLILVS